MSISEKARPKAPPPSKGHKQRIVTDEEVEKCLDWLRDYASKIGTAKGELVRLEHRLRTIEAFEMLKSDLKAQDAKRADARNSAAYKGAVDELAAATAEYETLRGLREAAVMKIETWRTESASLRNML